MTEFWTISLPGDKNPDGVFTKLTNNLQKYNGLATAYKFSIPNDLKVGTLDLLVGLCDELSKLDAYSEAITKKIAHYMGEVLEEQRHKLQDNLVVNGLALSTFLIKFQWDAAKYPVKQTLRVLFDILSEQISKIDSDLKARASAYNNIKSNLQNWERKQTGNLLSRDLQDIVKKEQFVVDSEWLTTLVVVVPKHMYNDWKAKHESLTEMVVPRSSELIFEDNDNGLWTVTLFKKMAEDFKNRARENKFIVRDFVYDDKKIEDSKNELTKLETDKKLQFAPLFRWLKVNFGECFSAMVHIKALRVFVESVLRYGLPVDFASILLQPNKKSHKRLRDVLNQHCKHFDSANFKDDTDSAATAAITGETEYFSYVSFSIDTNLVD